MNIYEIISSLKDNGTIELVHNNYTLKFSLSNNIIAYNILYNNQDKKLSIDKDKSTYSNDEELISFIKTTIGVFDTMKDDTKLIQDIEEFRDDQTDINTPNEEDGEEILLEEGSGSLTDGLSDAGSSITKVADRISELAKTTDDIEMKEIITSIANSAYSLAMDIKDAIETYGELQDEDIEDAIDDVASGNEELEVNV